MNLKYDLKDCDASVDIKGLEKFRVWYAEIMNMLVDDELSITNQIYKLTWETSTFHLVQESWNLTSQDPDNFAAQNSLINEMLQNGYVSSQILGVRRLTEKNAKDKNKHVNSVPHLLDKLEEALPFLTRENFVCYDGLPYDYEAAKKKDREESYKIAIAKGGIYTAWKPMAGPAAWSTSERMHEIFDFLSGVAPDKRSRGDTIRPDYTKSIRQHYDSISGKVDNLSVQADKFIAHAATEFSRQAKSASFSGFSFDDLDEIHKAIFMVINAVAYVVNEFFPPYIIAQYGICERLNKPWVRPEDISKLDEKWAERDAALESWESEFGQFRQGL